MGVRGHFHLISVEYFNCLITGQEPNSEQHEIHSINKSWYWLHKVFKRQPPPLDKIISGDYVPQKLAENTIELYIQDKTRFDFYFGLISPQLVIDVAQKLPLVKEDCFQNWCLEQGIEGNLISDLNNIKGIYSIAAEQEKALIISIT